MRKHRVGSIHIDNGSMFKVSGNEGMNVLDSRGEGTDTYMDDAVRRVEQTHAVSCGSAILELAS